ncbi:hypothetical protein K402DRAFT_402731 [Aulographum hederae CBS 113979]|uniref:Uncharacterized protein n=1 Tax=Aulographum hederae CBS 113979 TaxID=1176131 RepID=A0A6G1H659_9PEZI|nr:hypothetical protein K402DRAFT_402731 [Aulographum hederae CBS 113979]
MKEGREGTRTRIPRKRSGPEKPELAIRQFVSLASASWYASWGVIVDGKSVAQKQDTEDRDGPTCGPAAKAGKARVTAVPSRWDGLVRGRACITAVRSTQATQKSKKKHARAPAVVRNRHEQILRQRVETPRQPSLSTLPPHSRGWKQMKDTIRRSPRQTVQLSAVWAFSVRDKKKADWGGLTCRTMEIAALGCATVDAVMSCLHPNATEQQTLLDVDRVTPCRFRRAPVLAACCCLLLLAALDAARRVQNREPLACILEVPQGRAAPICVRLSCRQRRRLILFLPVDRRTSPTVDEQFVARHGGVDDCPPWGTRPAYRHGRSENETCASDAVGHDAEHLGRAIAVCKERQEPSSGVRKSSCMLLDPVGRSTRRNYCVWTEEPPLMHRQMIRFEGKSLALETHQEKFRHELYFSGDSDSEDEWSFSGLINHNLAVLEPDEATAGTDKALETLKNNMAAMEQEREARTPIQTPELAPTSRNNKYQKHLKKPSLLGGFPRSATASPLHTSTHSSTHLAPTSAAKQLNSDLTYTRGKDYEFACRTAVLHLLAIEPTSLTEICKKIRMSRDLTHRTLSKVAKLEADDKWKLADRSYKDLDVYKFKYSKEDRKTAIDNAIRAYDRQRVSRDDKLWDKLLPVKERGQGKILSRLNLNPGAAQTSSTPAVKPTKFDRKGMPKKEVKKDVKKEKKTNDGNPEQSRKSEQAKKPEKAERKVERKVEKREPKEKEMTKQEMRTKKLAERRAAQMESKKAAFEKAAKEDAKAASRSQNLQISRPKNPSPLSSSPPVNASDFEDNHPVHKRLSACASPAKSSAGNSDGNLKRKANDLDSSMHEHNISNKVRKVESSSTISGTPRQKRKADAVSSSHESPPPAKQRKLDPPIQLKQTNGIHSSSTSSQSSSSHSQGSVRPESSDSPLSDPSDASPLALSWRQTLTLAQQFKAYYVPYEKLYFELANATEPPTDEQRAELMKMHRKLESMKREIHAGALKQ